MRREIGTHKQPPQARSWTGPAHQNDLKILSRKEAKKSAKGEWIGNEDPTTDREIYFAGRQSPALAK